MCTANGSDAVAERVRLEAAAHGARCRVLRGGCYGLCEIGPNVVVRRHDGQLPDPNVDRLTLTDGDNESVYAGITPGDVGLLVDAHLVNDARVPELSREAREAALPPRSPVAEKLRKLRARRAASGSSG
jgi:(2Fe-2S) ferredoxin